MLNAFHDVLFFKQLYIIKILRTMKVTAVLLILCCLQASARVSSQGITLNVKNTPLNKVFQEIKQQTGYTFVYTETMLKEAKKVNINVKNSPLQEVLSICFETQPFTYKIIDQTVVVQPKQNIEDNTPSKVFSSQPPVVEISGRVLNQEGAPLQNVSVLIVGTKTGTFTNSDGRFILTSPDEKNIVLEFSSVGYQTKKMTVGNPTDIKVTLQFEVTGLTDVVVVGYGSQRKKDMTGAISSIKGSDLTHLPSQRVDQALQGKAAGVRVQTTDGGAPGAATIIRIRGSNSLQGGNNALIVVDGIQGGNLTEINPNDISSMEILKDASATAIYGAQGANGVVLITTKRGRSGSNIITYDYDANANKLSKKIALLNAGDYAKNINEYRLSQNGSGITPVPAFSQSEIDEFYKTGGTDWQDVIYRTAISQNHQLSVSGGLNGKVDYFVSTGYLDEQGILKNSDYKRFSLRANVNTTISRYLRAGINWSLAKQVGSGAGYGENSDWPNNAIGSALSFAPTVAPFDTSGEFSKYPPYGQPGYWNPLANAIEPYRNNNSLTNNIIAYVELKPFSGLTLRVSGSGILTSIDNLNYYNMNTMDGFYNNGSGSAITNNQQNYQNSNVLTYDTTFGKHHIKITGVAEQQAQNFTGFQVNGNKFTVQQTGIYDLSGAQTLTSSSSRTKRTLNSFMGRINYGFMDKYLLTATIRRDGSSVFGRNNKWGNFPALALSWNVINEEFMQKIDFLSNFKLRGSWGVTGNQAISPYGSLSKVTGGQNYPYNGSNSTDLGYGITTAANADLKWEKTTQVNIGVDLGFFGNRLLFTADYYNKITNDLLMARQLPTYTGLSTILDNVGSMRNRGVELAIQATPLQGRLRWNTGFNLSFNNSIIIDLGKSDSISVPNSNGHGGQTEGLPLSMLVKGRPLGEMYGFITQGTWGQKDAVAAATYGQLPGDVKYLDANSDGMIDIKDRRPMGNAFPSYTFGWSNDISYKAFNLGFQFVGSVGNKIFNLARYAIEGYPDGTGANLKNRWTVDNQNTDVPAIIDLQTRESAGLVSKISLPSSTAGLVSRWVEDASFLRLQYITLSYSLPKNLINKAGMSDISIHGSVANVFTVTKYQGYNPEVASFSGSDSQIGSDYNSYPATRVFNIGIHLTY